MKLNINFAALNKAVDTMGASHRIFTIDTTLSKIEDIDIKLKDGISVSIEEIEVLDNGLLSYKGRQVLLYIQDHGWKVQEALITGATGNKYHIADCSTLKDMKSKNRYDRYVAKNDINDYFFIDGKDTNNNHIKGETNLKVCKNCLSHINYNGYHHGERSQIFQTFSKEEFFKKYQQFFEHKPKYLPRQKSSTYPKNWKEISNKYKNSVTWTCEKCHVDLKKNMYLLDTHHINGVKQDCQNSNLKALCKECHANEPNHNHLKVSFEDKLLLQRLQQEQGITENQF